MIELVQTIHYGILYPAGSRPPGLSPAIEAKFVSRGWAKYVTPEGEIPNHAPTAPANDTEPANPSGAGSDDPAPLPADPKPEAFACEACRGKVFATAAALAGHLTKKHRRSR